MRHPLLLALLILAGLSRLSIAQPPAPQGEVSVRRSPLEITLSVHRTTLHVGEKIWVRMRVKNIGKAPVRLGDEIFRGQLDFMHAVEQSEFFPALRGPDGKDVKWKKEENLGGCPQDDPNWNTPGYLGLTPSTAPPSAAEAEETRKETGLIARWREQGVPDKKIDAMLDAQHQSFLREQADAERRKYPMKILKAGESFSTGSWVYRGICKDDRPAPPAPIADYAELWNYPLDVPGHYKIRAVYDERPTDLQSEDMKKEGRRPRPEQILVETPEIDVEVLP